MIYDYMISWDSNKEFLVTLFQKISNKKFAQFCQTFWSTLNEQARLI